jgi:ATP-dependent Clp protease ATP-binding subunit ClpA
MKWFNFFRKRPAAPAPKVRQLFDASMSNFTPRAQQVLALARQEAGRFNHNFIGTEHLLLGMIRLGQGTAVTVLGKLGLDLENVRLEVENMLGTGPDHKVFGNIPYTPRVKKVLALAAKEAKELNHTYVGTEHILLGLLREGDGVAARVLKRFEVDIEKTRMEILKELDPNFVPAANSGEPQPSKIVIVRPGSEMPQNPASPKPQGNAIDTTKRYDVYCSERTQEIVVYRSALFKGTKDLFKKNQYDIRSDYLELEQADGQTIFIARLSVIKFCEHGVTPGPESVSGKQP